MQPYSGYSLGWNLFCQFVILIITSLLGMLLGSLMAGGVVLEMLRAGFGLIIPIIYLVSLGCFTGQLAIGCGVVTTVLLVSPVHKLIKWLFLLLTLILWTLVVYFLDSQFAK